MTSRIAQAYDALVLRKPKLVLVALLSILVFFGYYTKDFRLDASSDSMLLEDDADLSMWPRRRRIHLPDFPVARDFLPRGPTADPEAIVQVQEPARYLRTHRL